MNQFGCPNAKDPDSPRAGTGGPDADSTCALLLAVVELLHKHPQLTGRPARAVTVIGTGEEITRQ